MKCPLATHWRCLASTQRDEILKAVQERDFIALNALRGKDSADAKNMTVDGNKSKDPLMDLPPKRSGLESYQTTEFICSMCSKGGICMNCKTVALEPESSSSHKAEADAPPLGSAIVAEADSTRLEGTDTLSEQNPLTGGHPKSPAIPSEELLFRCKLCKRISHYAHLPPPDGVVKDIAEGDDVETIAEYYQRDRGWSCTDCASFVYRAEKILAWRPYPANAPQPELLPGEPVNPKMALPREYLVKWQDRSYRRAQWVPHGWLASIHAGLLRHFLVHGPKVELLEHAVREDQVANAVSEGGVGGLSKELDDSSSRSRAAVRSESIGVLPSPDAERRIPPAWKTVDRVLDSLMWFPHVEMPKGNKRRGVSKGAMKSADATSSDARKEWNEAFERGEVPSAQNTITIDEWEAQKEDDLSVDDIDHVVWAFIKWDDLGYDEGMYLRLQKLGPSMTPKIIATWDSPPRQGEPGYSAFKIAFGRFLDSRNVQIKLRSKQQIETFENRRRNEFRQRYALKQDQQPDIGQQEQLKLMPFQVK